MGSRRIISRAEQSDRLQRREGASPIEITIPAMRIIREQSEALQQEKIAAREALAQAAAEAAIADIKPNASYADVTIRTTALDSARYALGLKELPPAQEGEQ